MIGWENFFSAQVGASAALVGLLFVSVSINLTRILSLPGLPNRARITGFYYLTSYPGYVLTDAGSWAGIDVHWH